MLSIATVGMEISIYMHISTDQPEKYCFIALFKLKKHKYTTVLDAKSWTEIFTKMAAGWSDLPSREFDGALNPAVWSRAEPQIRPASTTAKAIL